ncbi:DUF982 domain-containing protein [Pararhizobium sp. DWP3-4]|uniref:DUF982 domain-containing protein n=1 Tax=Pararhizobium sp. DWP3-4 TaxID=2804565 RepID=UPI003CFAC2AB
MNSDRLCQFPAIWLLTGVGERYKPVDTVAAAAEVLLNEWPQSGGREYRFALEACLYALQDRGPSDAVPRALMRAADEAFICYIRVVKDGKQEALQSSMSPQQHAIRTGSKLIGSSP